MAGGPGGSASPALRQDRDASRGFCWVEFPFWRLRIPRPAAVLERFHRKSQDRSTIPEAPALSPATQSTHGGDLGSVRRGKSLPCAGSPLGSLNEAHCAKNVRSSPEPLW